MLRKNSAHLIIVSKPRISGIAGNNKQVYIYNMLKYGIIALFIALIGTIGLYFFLKYKVDTIIVYDREAAFINVDEHLSVKPGFMINKDKELRVFLDFQNIQEEATIQKLDVKLRSSRKESPLLSVTADLSYNYEYALTFPELPAVSRQIHPSTTGTITFAFDTRNINSSNYSIIINGSILTEPGKPATSFSKKIDIEKEHVLSERSWLF